MSTERAQLGSCWLVGLMGSGKSTVGRALAAATGRPYVDNDATIAALAGRSTADLSSDGGSVLHEWEESYVRHLVARRDAVVAGIPASCADRGADLALLASTGVLVYLRCSPSTLVNRVLADPPRPWLSASRETTETLIAGMFAARDDAMTASAQLTVDGERAVDDIVADLLAFQRTTANECSARTT